MPDNHIQKNEVRENEEFSPDDTLPKFEFSNDEDTEISKNEQDDRSHRFDSSGCLVVRNPSAFWIPELEITEMIHGTIYTVTGSYEGTGRLDQKLLRLLGEQMEGES